MTMLIGNAPCSWGINYPTGNAYTWAQYLDEVAAAGYRGTELGPFGFLPKDKAVLREELAKRNLTLIGATHVHTFGDRASAPVLMSTLREELTLTEMFISAFYGVIDPRTSELIYANTGHPHAFHLPDGEDFVRLGASQADRVAAGDVARGLDDLAAEIDVGRAVDRELELAGR